MAITQLEENTALVVIDLQKGIVGMPTVTPSDQIIDRSARLAEAFRAQGQTVVLVNVTGGAPGRTETPPAAGERPADWAELVPELGEQDSDVLITKQTWGAFANTSLDSELRDLGVTQIVLTGISTSAGVESTARSAHELGYHVVLVTDAMTDRSSEAHENSVERIFPRLGEIATTGEVLDLLS